jgi:hypothetical protein
VNVAPNLESYLWGTCVCVGKSLGKLKVITKVEANSKGWGIYRSFPKVCHECLPGP